MKSLPNTVLSRRNLRFGTLMLAVIPIAVALTLTVSRVQAANLLVNPSFETNSGNVIPSGWARFAPPTAQVNGTGGGNYYVQGDQAPPHSGALCYKEWGACYNGTNNAAGIYQDVSIAPGSAYHASVWFYTRSGDILGPDCYVWIEVLFLNSGGSPLALFKSSSFSQSVGTDNWFQYQVTNACDLSSPVSIGDPFFTTYAVTGAVSQLVAPPGTSTARYRFVYVQFQSEGGSCFLDDAVLNEVSGSAPPVIGSLFPLNMIFVNPSDGISFNVSSPSGSTINSSAIGLVVNGVNVSGSLNISGTSSNKNVAYHGLQSNTVYRASITVTDSFNLTASANTYFETTWVSVPPIAYLWEAEDFDFTNGMFYDFPTLCTTVGSPNCYFGTVGNEGVDEHFTGTAPTHAYRPDDAMGTVIAGDYARKDHVVAGVFDYRIDPFNGGNNAMWVNYTRDWPSGTYWVLGRLSSGISPGMITLSRVNSDTTTTDLGTFTLLNGTDWSTFQNIYLQDTNGNNVIITLNGKQTLRITSGGNLLPNFFMLASAPADLPVVSYYPTGKQPFEPTNAFTFTVTTAGSSFPPNGIRLSLDGIDVSANLQITGPTSTKTAVYPNLMLDAVHVAIIAVTNALGHGILVTNRFDTFSQSNYMVEAEDFDHDGGQFFDTGPNAYAGYGGTTNIDFEHITLSGETAKDFTYRPIGIPQDVAGDFVRQIFVFPTFGTDYSLVFFAATDWANYTRTYPAGSYFVYIRTSGDGPFSMYLDRVVSGATTSNQVTRRLGHFGGVGTGYKTYNWVPLTDDGLAAPVLVKLNGVTTLRLTTGGNCNPNFFMLVPATGITLTAARSAGNTVVSFPTQTGAAYRVFYRTNLAIGTWTLLSPVLGNGALQSVSDPATGTSRFYKVTAP